MEEQPGQMSAARDLLQRAGLYRTLGNFGPLFPNKLDRLYRHIETLTIGEYEYMIIESEAMSFSLASMEMSSPYKQREAWFQPVKKC